MSLGFVLSPIHLRIADVASLGRPRSQRKTYMVVALRYWVVWATATESEVTASVDDKAHCTVSQARNPVVVRSNDQSFGGVLASRYQLRPRVCVTA